MTETVALEGVTKRYGAIIAVRDLDLALREQTGLAITVAEDPLNCVALGTGKSLEYETQLAHVLEYN